MTNDKKYMSYFQSNMIFNFFETFKKWFEENVYTDQNYSVISLYNKQLQQIKQLRDSETNSLMPQIKYPQLIFTPDVSVTNDVQTSYLWKYMSTSNIDIVKDTTHPFIEQEDLVVYPVFNRIKGSINVNTIFESLYQYFDYFILINQKFKGVGNNRIITPFIFNVDLVISDDLCNLEMTKESNLKLYFNKYFKKKMDLSTGKVKYFYPLSFKPSIKFQSISDNAVLNNSNDINEYRVQMSIEYELNLLVFNIVEFSSFVLKYPKTMFNLESPTATEKEFDIPKNIEFEDNKYSYDTILELNIDEQLYNNIIEKNKLEVIIPKEYYDHVKIQIKNNNDILTMSKENKFIIQKEKININDNFKFYLYKFDNKII